MRNIVLVQRMHLTFVKTDVQGLAEVFFLSQNVLLFIVIHRTAILLCSERLFSGQSQNRKYVIRIRRRLDMLTTRLCVCTVHRIWLSYYLFYYQESVRF